MTDTPAPSTQKINLDKDLLAILCCPETKQAVCLITDEELSLINERIDQGHLQNHGNSPVKEKIQGGLIRSDRKRMYPIRENIPILLIEEGISVEGIFK